RLLWIEFAISMDHLGSSDASGFTMAIISPRAFRAAVLFAAPKPTFRLFLIRMTRGNSDSTKSGVPSIDALSTTSTSSGFVFWPNIDERHSSIVCLLLYVTTRNEIVCNWVTSPDFAKAEGMNNEIRQSRKDWWAIHPFSHDFFSFVDLQSIAPISYVSSTSLRFVSARSV